MSKRTDFPASTRHLLIYDEDWEYLESRFGPRGIKPVGVSTVIRAILHQKVMALRAKEIETQDANRRALPAPVRVSGAHAQAYTLTED